MELNKLRRLAATVLKTGEKNVWMDPSQTKRIKEALTKDDVRALIGERIIRKKKRAAHSRGAARILKEKKKRGRKRGHGKRKGTKKARAQKKRTWILSVRGQRKFLRELKTKKKLDKKKYTKIYNLVKGGYFKGKKQIVTFLKEHKG